MKKAETQNNKLPRGWRKVKLGEITIPGGSVSGPFGSDIKSIYFRPAGVPIIRGNNLTMNIDKGRYIDDNYIFLDPKRFKELKKAEALPEDIIITARGTIGQTGIIPKNSKYPRYIISANQLRFRIDKQKADPLFVYYQLSSKYITQQMQNYSVNVGVPNFNLNAARNLELLIPEDINEQKRIADILSAFDDKIEVNNKIIKTLEEMAQEIFKEWFVRFRFPGWQKVKFIDSELGKIPEGWQVKFLSEFFDFLEGPGIRNWQYTTSGCRFINIRLIQNNDIDIKSANFISTEEANGKYKHFHLQERDMIVSTSGTLGRSAIVRKEHLPLLLNTSVIRFRPKDKKNYGFMYQFLNSIYFQNKILSMASGSAQPNFGPVHLKQIKLVVPNKDILNLFSTLIDPVYEKIIILKSENQKLATFRDLLLPKLMSGEVRV